MSANEAYISGVGQSEVGVKLTRLPLLLTVDAVREALDEAGLTISQIDGVSTYPGRVAAFLGFSPVGADELIDALGIRATWHSGGGEISSQLGAVVAAAMAVRTARRGMSFVIGLSMRPRRLHGRLNIRRCAGKRWTATRSGSPLSMRYPRPTGPLNTRCAM